MRRISCCLHDMFIIEAPSLVQRQTLKNKGTLMIAGTRPCGVRKCNAQNIIIGYYEAAWKNKDGVKELFYDSFSYILFQHLI